MRYTLCVVSVGVMCAVVGFAGGWFWHTPLLMGPLSIRQSDIASSTRYTFIDPLLAIRNPDDGNSPEYSTLLNSTNALITDAQNKQVLQTASVYFRDMGQSKGFSIHGDEQYSPASLLKVPTLMSYLNLSEGGSSILSSQATYSGADADAQEHIKSPVQLARGTYSVQTLLEHMIKNSDNNAAQALINHLNTTGNSQAFGTLFKDLGVSQIDLTNDFVTVRAYALFFRVLYNATYLNRSDSERALELLSQTDFKYGLRAGVPGMVPVAHKFGEFSLEGQTGVLLKRELHDCGIAYYPKHPYLLCVMTKGSDFAQLEGFIANVSKGAYQFMAAKYPPTH